MDEGMLRCGLQAAAQRLPFLPIRAGLGSDVRAFWGDELKTVKSPYPTDGGFEELIAMPALRLDAAFVHMNLGDAQGNAAYTGIDPYFDDLFLMAAEQARTCRCERVVPTDELVKAVPPQALLINRMMVDTVVEAPNGAHFTTAEPDYRRDEKFQRHYAEAAASDETWQQFVATYLSRQRGRLPGRRAGSSQQEAASDFRDPCRGVRRRVRRTVPRRTARSWSARWRPWCRSAPGWPG